MKEVIGKAWKTQPCKIIVNNLKINEEKQIANKFDNSFIGIGPEPAKQILEPTRSFESYIPRSNTIVTTGVGPELAKEIPEAVRSFESYIPRSSTIMSTGTIIVNELKNAFFSMKTNKCPGHDEINFIVIRSYLGELCEPLQYPFNLSFKKCIFPDDLRKANVTPVFKAGDNTELSNYRQISVLPCFSKILERAMYNRLYKYLLILRYFK